MRKAHYYLSAMILLCFIIKLQASESTNYQVWSGVGVSKEINSKFELAFDKEIRFETGIHEKNFDKMTLAAKYDLSSWLQLGGEYWRGQIKSGTEWKKEQKPVLFLNFKYNTFLLELSARHKLEYRIIQKYDNIPVYKFRTQVKYNFQNIKVLSEAYINDEIFVNLNNNTLYLNRMRAGFKLKYGFLTPDINYVFQLSKKDAEWRTIHAFAVKVWLEF